MRILRFRRGPGLIAAAAIASCGALFGAGSPGIGELAPDFTARTLDGGSIELSRLRGRPVILNFWAPWCVPCRVETPWLVDLDARYRSRLAIVGVVADDSARGPVAKFVETFGVRYPIVLDGRVAGAFGGVPSLPQTFFIDRRGRIVSTIVGVEGRERIDGEARKLLGDAEGPVDVGKAGRRRKG